ncbi:MAG: hypothetical protein ABIZ83_00340 [Casimicrobium sp.]
MFAIKERRLARSELRPFAEWNDGRPETELNFKLYRQATSNDAGAITLQEYEAEKRKVLAE